MDNIPGWTKLLSDGMGEGSQIGGMLKLGLGRFGHIIFGFLHSPPALTAGRNSGSRLFCATGRALKRGTNAYVRQVRNNISRSF